MIKSRAKKIVDYKAIDLSQYTKNFTVDQALLEKDMNRILRGYSKKVEADKVESGDMVTLSCKSENSKYNKENLVIPVGRGMFSKELEKDMIGKGKEAENHCKCDGVDVAYKISRIVRTILPELTDQGVASLGMEDVKSVADLRRYCINKQVDNYVLDAEEADMASALLWQTVAAESEFIYDPEELKLEEEAAIKNLQEMENRPEEPADEDQEEFFEDEEENAPEMDMEAFFKQISVTELETAVIGRQMMLEKGKNLSKADYQAYIEKRKKLYPELSEAQLLEKYPEKKYYIETYAEYFCLEMDAYVAEYFKKTVNA